MLALLAALALAAPAPHGRLAPGEERWAALSHTATAITGDIRLSPRRLKTPRAVFPLTVARDDPAFGGPSFGGPKTVAARVLKVTAPADPVLLNGNRLCAGQGVRWIAVWREDGGKTLEMAAFSGEAPPGGLDAPGLCGTFSYTR